MSLYTVDCSHDVRGYDSEEDISILCPKCDKWTEGEADEIVAVVDGEKPLICKHCGTKYYINVIALVVKEEKL